MTLAAILCALGACAPAPGPSEPDGTAPVPEAPAPAPAPGPVFVGVVLPVDTVEIALPFEARIAELPVDMGESVLRGQVVATIDADAMSERIEGARAAVSAGRSAAHQAAISLAEAEASHAQLELAREAVPAAEIATAAFAVERQRSVLREAEARQAQQRAALAELEAELGDGEVRSPIDGVVAAKLVSAGARIGPHAPILRIASGALGVRFGIEPEAMGKLAVGDRVRVELPVNGVALSAQVLRVSPWVDSASGVILAEASVTIPPEDVQRVVAGMTARVSAEEDDGA